MKRSSFFRIFSYMKKNITFYVIGVIVVGLLISIFQIELATLFRNMFDSFSEGDFNIFSEIKYNLLFIIIALLILPFFSYLVRRINVITSGNIRKDIANKLTRLPASYFKKNHSGDIISRCTNDISETERAYNIYLYNFITSLLMGIFTVTYTFILSWQLALMSISAALLILFVNIFYTKKLRRVSGKIQDKLGKLNERFSNIISGIQIIRVFNIQRLIFSKYDNSNYEIYKNSKKKVGMQSVINTLDNLVFLSTFLGIGVFGAYLAIHGYIESFGVIIAVVQLQNGLTGLVYGVGTFVTQMQTSLAAADRVFAIIDEDEEPVSYQNDKDENVILNDAVNFNNVSFKYEEELVLNNLHFTLPKNKVYALVGPSGGGKSTVFKLILNYYPPLDGNIYIDGKSIFNQKIKDIRNQIAYVPQDSYLFTGSIKENIRFGNMKATDEEIINAAKLANAHHFIEQLEHGYDTNVGEGGAQLSGGQRQRIAIARAILKNAPILLLDEATSALDSESEQLVQDALQKLMIDKTTLVIAHRLSTIKDSDQILVIGEGKVLEQGTHEMLLENEDGIYTNLYNKQFSC